MKLMNSVKKMGEILEALSAEKDDNEIGDVDWSKGTSKEIADILNMVGKKKISFGDFEKITDTLEKGGYLTVNKFL
jgi:hypothetical protein